MSASALRDVVEACGAVAVGRGRVLEPAPAREGRHAAPVRGEVRDPDARERDLGCANRRSTRFETMFRGVIRLRDVGNLS